jgi:hypothetical protein
MSWSQRAWADRIKTALAEGNHREAAELRASAYKAALEEINDSTISPVPGAIHRSCEVSQEALELGELYIPEQT